MESTGVAVIDLRKETAARLGKKGSSSDYTIYNRKTGDDVYCFYEPSMYPEKLVSLLHCLNSSDLALLVFDGVTKEAGEAIVALDSLGMNGVVACRDGSKEDLAPLAKGTVVEKFVESPPDDASIMDALASLKPTRDASAPVRVTIDSSFSVKSVGLVVLGIVKRGVVSVHDELKSIPSGKKAVVRSLQVQDKDVQASHAGDRVGLCLKNVELEDVERGSELVKDESVAQSSELEVEVELNRFQKSGLADGTSVFASFGMQYASARVSGSLAPASRGKIKLSFAKPFAFEKGAAGLLADPARPLRILGKIRF